MSNQSLVEYKSGLSGCLVRHIHCDMDQTQEEAAPHSGVCSSF
jgi:hypothetical protein